MLRFFRTFKLKVIYLLKKFLNFLNHFFKEIKWIFFDWLEDRSHWIIYFRVQIRTLELKLVKKINSEKNKLITKFKIQIVKFKIFYKSTYYFFFIPMFKNFHFIFKDLPYRKKKKRMVEHPNLNKQIYAYFYFYFFILLFNVFIGVLVLCFFVFLYIYYFS